MDEKQYIVCRGVTVLTIKGRAHFGAVIPASYFSDSATIDKLIKSKKIELYASKNIDKKEVPKGIKKSE